MNAQKPRHYWLPRFAKLRNPQSRVVERPKIVTKFCQIAEIANFWNPSKSPRTRAYQWFAYFF
jgi:hypothetical protein